MNVWRRVSCLTLPALVWALGLWLSAGAALAQDPVKKNTKFPQQILIIRHSEKTGDKGDAHLSKKGLERADVIYQLFVASKNRPDPFPTPDFIFAASNAKDSQRPIETVTPLAMKLKLPIVDTYTSKLPDAAGKKPSMVELRDHVFGESKYFGKTILVSWRHSTISKLAETLKATKVPSKWEDQVFDRVWQINYDDQGNAAFLDRPMRLLPGDAEK
jgi:hypothetical protein